MCTLRDLGAVALVRPCVGLFEEKPVIAGLLIRL